MRDMRTVMALLRSIGFVPRTVLDVGALHGTPAISSVFADAFHLWFEPNADVLPDLNRFAQRFQGEVHPIALGDTDTEMDLFVGQAVGGVRVLEATERARLQGLPDLSNRLRRVQVRRLDSVLAGRALEGPVLLKTDCQGFDLAVLRGAAASLPGIDVVAAEVHMFRSHPGAPDNTFDSVHSLMRQAGFALFEIVDPLPRPKDGVIAQVDAIYINEHGRFPRPVGWM